MTANDDKVGFAFLGNTLYFALRTSENEVLMRFGHFKLARKFGKMDFGLILNLILNRRQIHGYVASIGGAQWFYDMHNVHSAGRVAYDLFHSFCQQG